MVVNDRYRGRHVVSDQVIQQRRMVDGAAWKELNTLLDLVERETGSDSTDSADLRQAIANRLEEMCGDPDTPFGLAINVIREDEVSNVAEWRKRWHMDVTKDGPVLHCERSLPNGCGCAHMEPIRTGLGFVRMAYALRRHVLREHQAAVAVG